MSTLLEELTALKTAEDRITGNKVANFAYDDYAYEHDDANGVDTYNVNNHQNIPNGTANILKVNSTILTKGWRAQASAITRMLIDHFLGRCSYNLNKVNDHFSTLLTKLMSFLEAPNGIATLNSEGKVTALNNVLNTGDSGTPIENGTTKFTTGGAYDFFGGKTSATRWLTHVFSWALGRLWDSVSGWFVQTNFNYVAYANNMWVACREYEGLAWSQDGKEWKQGQSTSTEIVSLTFTHVRYANGIWVASACIGVLPSVTRIGLWWSTDGKNWTQGTGAITYEFKYVAYESGIWVACSVSHGLWWSTDGKAWTQGTGATPNSFNWAVSNGNLWVACSIGSGLWWSTDGKAWTQGTGATTYDFNCVTYRGSVWVACSDNQGLWRSTDGKAWSQLSVASNKSFYHIYTDKGVWIACCVGGMYKSTDNGANWSPCTIDVDSTRLSTMIFMVSFHINKSWIEGGNLDGFWLAGSSDGIFYSADGTKWSCALDLANSNFSSFAYNGLERIVATKSLYGNGLWYSDYTLALQD